MEELKPCPFCDGEALLIGDYAHGYFVECHDCSAKTANYGSENKAEAIAAWNSRAERTCHIVKNSRKYVLSDGRELFDDGCSICNGYVGDGDNYCSNCGAKVVTDGQ